MRRTSSVHSLLISFLGFLLFIPALGQKSGGGKSSGGPHSTTSLSPTASYNPNYKPTSTEGEFDSNVVFLSGDNHPIVKNELPSCFSWPLSPIQSSTVSVTGMEISSQAKEQFTSSCEAIQKKNLKEAKQRLDRIVGDYPKYAAAWVLLGQTSKEQGNFKQAENSCARARDADPNYLPSYLCLADLAARQDDWNKVAELTNHALGMHPVRAPGAYYYNTLAYFYLKQWPEAEHSGLLALQDSSKKEKSELHWLLAKVYEQKKDRDAEAQQLREYLALGPDGADASTVQRILKQIERQSGKQ